ncbi:hypothetical protein HZA98_04740 [Candidatus Woesearchaeota archaeon]|nr:hypothetical protein [Candidatus Woesearchaeota archaeon]
MLVYKILLLPGIILGVVAQLLLKYGVSKYGKRGIFRMIFNWPIFFGFALYGVSMLIWLVVISELDLSYAYPMVSSGYFFVAFSSQFIFKEKVSLQRWLSIFVIVLGVALVGIS